MPLFRRKKKHPVPTVVNPNGGLQTPRSLENKPGSVPAIVHTIQRPLLSKKKPLFFVSPPTMHEGFYADVALDADAIVTEDLISIEKEETKFTLYGKENLDDGTEVIAREFVTPEGIIHPNVMQVITYKRKGSGRVDMPESHDEIDVLNIGYMFKSNLKPQEEFVPIPRETPLFQKTPSITDIEQSWMGDCFLLATLNSILAVDQQVDAEGNPIDPTHSGASFIENMMVRDGDDVIVRLYDPRTLEPVYIRVKAANHHKNGELAHNHRAVWVHVIETAYAVFGMTSAKKDQPGLNIDKEKIVVNVPSFLSVYGSGGQIRNAMTILTGMESSYVPFTNNVSKLNPFNSNDITFLASKVTPLATDLFQDPNYSRIENLAKDDATNQNFNNFDGIVDEFKNEIIKNENTLNWIDEHIRRTLFAKMAENDKDLLREWSTYFLVLQFFYPTVLAEMSKIFKGEVKNRGDFEDMLTKIVTSSQEIPPKFPALPESLQQAFRKYVKSNSQPENLLINYVQSKITSQLPMLDKQAGDDLSQNNFKNFQKIFATLSAEVNQTVWQKGRFRLFGIFECLNEDVELQKQWGTYLYTLSKYYPNTYSNLQTILQRIPTSNEEANDLIKDLEKFIPKIPADVLAKIKKPREAEYYVGNKISSFTGPIGSGEYRLEEYQVFDDIERLLRSGSLVSAGTLSEFKDPVPGLRPSHAYTITKVQRKKVDDKELLLITLRNPWNSVGRACDFSKEPVVITEDKALPEFTLDLTDFLQYFEGYTFGKLPSQKKLEEELTESNKTFTSISNSVSFGLLSASAKEEWIRDFFAMNKQVRDSHLMHQLSLDYKNIWEIAHCIDQSLALNKMVLTANNVEGNCATITNKTVIYGEVLKFSKLIPNQKDTFDTYNREAAKFFRKGYKNFTTPEAKNKFIARLLTVGGNIEYHVQTQGVDDLYQLIKDLKQLIATQKTELKKSKNKSYQKYLNQALRTETQVLCRLQKNFKERLETSTSFDVIQLNADRFLDQNTSIKKSFVRTFKSMFKHNDEDKALKMYARHLKQNMKDAKPDEPFSEKQFDMAKKYFDSDSCHAKELIINHLLATELKDGKVSGNNLNDTISLKAVMLKVCSKKNEPVVYRWQQLVPEQLRDGQLESVNVVDGLYTVTIKKDNVNTTVTLTNTESIAGGIALQLVGEFTSPKLIKTEDNVYCVETTISILDASEKQSFPVSTDLLRQWSQAQQRQDDNERANRQFLLRRISQDKIPLVTLAQTFLNGLGKDQLVASNLGELQVKLRLNNPKEIAARITSIEVQKSPMHDFDGKNMYSVNLNVNGLPNPGLRLLVNEKQMYDFAIAQYKELIWNNTYILSQITTSNSDIIGLANRHLGKGVQFAPSDVLCRITHKPAKHIRDFTLVAMGNDSVKLTVTFKNKLTSEILLTERDIKQFAIAQYRVDQIELLRHQSQQVRKRFG